jgi:hypothetical protein
MTSMVVNVSGLEETKDIDNQQVIEKEKFEEKNNSKIVY